METELQNKLRPQTVTVHRVKFWRAAVGSVDTSRCPLQNNTSNLRSDWSSLT
ncbi:hypothetical protein DPMN_071580 [Dreissena polymorpha]|uniref:Uncharacterized protein n=1 Tax=Dreissena polymorpha TaxID=45954 RepID=A0A9D4BWB9_DREPO|nr:hypothetical protein DPMN_071580 [Dreissena polymorpha]